MKKFVKITTREKDMILRTWMDIDEIAYFSQTSTQEGLNEGICVTKDLETIPLIAFNETIDSLNK